MSLSDAEHTAKLDSFTIEMFNELFAPGSEKVAATKDECTEARNELEELKNSKLTHPILEFFSRLIEFRRKRGILPSDLGLNEEDLYALALRHEEIDEHSVTVGGRLGRARPIVDAACERVNDYMHKKDTDAASGIELWGKIQENAERISKKLGMRPEEWNTYQGQLAHAIDSVDTLSSVIDLPASVIRDVLRVTQSYRLRITPYYASLIQPEIINDPVLLQCVPTGEMLDNVGEEIMPVAADHSPARLIDQFYPRVVTIKSTNMCAMYCTHCLRIAHIGKKDKIYCKEAYEEALDYIRKNTLIRDVLVTGGDAFVLPNSILEYLLSELDSMDHIKVKRLGTRIPVTAPMRVDNELLDILAKSNEKKPIRVVTQINTAQEITPLSRDVFRKLCQSSMTVMNQAVLLKGINDTPVKMWKLCETIQEAYVRPYYVFNCSYRNTAFAHLRVPVETGRDIIESMYGNISGDAIPRYICTAGGKVPMHRDNVIERKGTSVILRKPWSGEQVEYPDADPEIYAKTDFSFARYGDK